MDNMRVLLDRLEQATRARRGASGLTSPPLPSSPPVPGLRYQSGEKVLDLASGRKGTVVAGVRDDSTGRQLYNVELVTGQTVVRSLDELGADTLPTAPGLR